MRRILFTSLVIASMTLTAPSAIAASSVVALGLQSGSQSGSQSGTQGGRDLFPVPQRDPAAQAYRSGKALISRKIACKKCEYSGGVKDVATARDVAARVRAGEFELSTTEQQQVLVYLNSRFGV